MLIHLTELLGEEIVGVDHLLGLLHLAGFHLRHGLRDGGIDLRLDGFLVGTGRRESVHDDRGCYDACSGEGGATVLRGPAPLAGASSLAAGTLT